ncbi:MAG: hypothetical protein H0Z34_00520 [Brevibacillus sp.]|nr:hypothetical protein [Brevibacillus sp.]
MIPEEIRQLLHDIRLIGGGRDRYDSPDDWEVIENILDARNVRVDRDTPDWELIRRVLLEEKEAVKEEMDQFYWDAYW